MKISERIFMIMDQKGISQLEFSKATEIAQSVISDWKRKKTNPGADKLVKIARFLEVTVEELLVAPNGELYE